MTPVFVAITSAFLLLEEREQGVSAFYQVTPAEGISYLAARIALPMIGAFLATLIVSIAFTLSSLSFNVILLSALISSFTGIALAMMVVSIAGNRVEGLSSFQADGNQLYRAHLRMGSSLPRIILSRPFFRPSGLAGC